MVEAAPANIALFTDTRERSQRRDQSGAAGALALFRRRHRSEDTFDCIRPRGKDCATLDLGVDAYYKIAKDLIDNGTFGQALVFSAFNYAKGVNRRHRVQREISHGNFQAYGNLAVGQEKATRWCRTNICSTTSRRSPISAA